MTTILKEPIITIAYSQADLAERRAGVVAGLVAVALNYMRAHGDPEEVCKAYEPSLTAALGAWWDEHFTSTEALREDAAAQP